MVNKSRGALAYTVIDADDEIAPGVADAVAAIENVYKVRLIG